MVSDEKLEDKDGDSEKVSKPRVLKTGNYIIKVNKESTNHLKILEEMCKLKNNEKLTSKEKNARLKDILAKKETNM